jgi:hypothetical protein
MVNCSSKNTSNGCSKHIPIFLERPLDDLKMKPDVAICGTPLTSPLSTCATASSSPTRTAATSHLRLHRSPEEPVWRSSSTPHHIRRRSPRRSSPLLLSASSSRRCRAISPRSCSAAAPPASIGRPSYLGSAFSPASLTRVAAGKPVRAAVGECGGARAGAAGKSAAELPSPPEAISDRDAPVCHL